MISNLIFLKHVHTTVQPYFERKSMHVSKELYPIIPNSQSQASSNKHGLVYWGWWWTQYK